MVAIIHRSTSRGLQAPAASPQTPESSKTFLQVIAKLFEQQPAANSEKVNIFYWLDNKMEFNLSSETKWPKSAFFIGWG